MSPWLTEGTLVGVMGVVGVVVGHWTQRRTSRDDIALRGNQIALEALRGQVMDLTARLRDSEAEIKALHGERTAERARSWAALEYCRALTRWGEALRDLVPEGTPGVPEAPPVPVELNVDL